MKPMVQLRRAWRLYRTDSQVETLMAVGMVLLVLYPFAHLWWQMRRGGGR